jgi:response regulator RpfG family c-di-GMP phosphodiesterase
MGNSNSKAAKRIVVVDDNEDICAFMSAALKNAGYVVETATEGAQGLAVVQPPGRPARHRYLHAGTRRVRDDLAPQS